MVWRRLSPWLANWLRRELRLALLIFPATFVIGFVAQFLFSQAMQQAALQHQRQLLSDLGLFTPLVLPKVIAAAAVGAWSDWVAHSQRVGWFIGFFYLPLHTISIIFRVVGSAWETQTVLGAGIVTAAFLTAAPIVVGGMDLKGGILTGVALALLIGSVLCTLLWALVWLGLQVFGGLTVLAGYCALIAGATSGVVSAYVSFRASRFTEQRLEI